MANLNLNSFKLIKRDQWQELVDKIAAQQAEISSATAFIKEIEKGNLESTSIGDVDENSLTGSLVNMRNKMKEIAQEEDERNWITEGLAKFSDILRSNNDDLTTLSNEIISELVKYMGANQGGLFLINDNDKEDVYIELIAAYAYNRKKFIEQKIRLGQGILGQAALEKDTVILKDVPANYVKITSGLGEALPRNIIIVPLKLEERVYGLVEIASFQIIKKHQIQFVEKLSENLASTIASAKNAERTQKLLKESQIQTEQLRSQEEEVRQNMEELAATQEEMQRINVEVQRKEKEVSELLNASHDSIVLISRGYKILMFNKAFAKTFKNHTIEKDYDYLSLFDVQTRARIKSQYDVAFRGETIETIDQMTASDGSITYYRIKGVPIVDENMGMVGSLALYVADVTELYKAKESAESLASEAHHQAEELRAQEEELKQNMEELSATQEEMQRILTEVQKNEKEISELINVSDDSILTMDRQNRIVLFNKAFTGMVPPGIKIEKGFNVMQIYSPEEQKQRQIVHDKAFAGEKIEVMDHVTQGGLDLYIKIVFAPLFDIDGKVASVAVFASDVTEIHKAKLIAEEKEKEVTQLLNVSTDSILTMDKDYRIILFNSSFAATFPKHKFEKGFDSWTLFPPEAKPMLMGLYNKVFAGETVEVVDDKQVEATGKIFNVKYSPLKGIDGKVIGIAVFASDITEIHKAKLLAEQNEREVNELISVSSDSILTIDRNYKIVRFNKAVEEVFKGVAIKGLDLLSVLGADAAPRKKIYDQVFKTGKLIEDLDHIVLNGQERYSRVRYAPLFDGEGKVAQIAIYASDVTEAYRAKAIAEQNEKAVTELINASSDSIVTIDKDSKVILFNQVFASSLKGFKVEKGFSTLSLYGPEEQKKKKEAHRKVLAGETVESLDHIKIDGKDGYYRVKYSPLFDVDGKVNSIAAYVTDVTDLYQAKQEAELKAKEAQQQAEEVKAQEEEIRQNMEEMQAIQEELSRKNTEMEKVRIVERDRADALIQSQKKNMQNIMSKFKQLEADYKKKIAELEKKSSKK